MDLTKEEIKNRLEHLRKLLKEKNCEVAIISYPLHIFYFTGTFVKGVLVVTYSDARLLVNRPLTRAKKESFVSCERLKSLKELPLIIKELGSFKKVGLEAHHLNIDNFKRFLKILSEWEVERIDSLIFELRKVKSNYEVECITKAGKMLDRALKAALKQIKPGMSEIKASAILEKELRERGHPGFTRSLLGFELSFGYFISGKEGVVPTHFITGEGGTGVPGFPGGACLKKLKASEPILIDFAGYCKGYYTDQTRMASFKPIKRAEDFYKVAIEIIKTLEKEVKPGIISEEVYEQALLIAEKAGFKEYFMSHGENVKFVGHGVGLQIDEPPAIAVKQKEVLKKNMVIALEPKFHVPEFGVIGVEDTFLVTINGLKRLTPTSHKWINIK